MMTQDLNKQFNIPAWVKGNTIADESASIMKRFEGRNDNASIATKEALLKSVMKKQEFLKMQEAMKTQSQQIPDQMNGEVPEGMEQFMSQDQSEQMMPQEGQMAYGGRVNKLELGGQAQQMWNADGAINTGVKPNSSATPDVSAGSVVGAAGTALELGKTAFGPSGIDTSGLTAAPEVQSRGMGAASGALKGAAAGASFGPWGAAIGGVVGGVAGLIGAGKAKRDAQEAGQQFTFAQNAQYRQSDFAFGGAVTPTGGPGDPPTDPTLKQNITGFIEGRSRAATKLVEDARLGAFPEVGMKITHPSNNRTYNVMFNDPNKDRSLVQDDKGGYSLQSNRNLQLNNKGEGWETGGEQPMTSAEAQYFMKNTRPTQMAMGGQVNKFDGITNPSSWLTKPRVNPNINFDKIDLDLGNMKSSTGDWDASIGGATTLEQDSSKLDSAKALTPGDRTSGVERTNTGKTLDWLGKNAGNIAQYAPIASNLLALKNLKKGTTDRGTRMDRVYQPQQFDEAQLINQINQDNTNAALRESSGGDLGALRANLLGADINKRKALSQGMAGAAEVNRAENQFAFQSGMQKDQINAQLEGDYINRRAQDTGAYETIKAKLQRQIAEDAGAIGKEEVDKKLVKEMFGYKWNGKYYIDKDGKVVPNNVVAAQVADAKTKEATNASQYGGYLKK